ncbi:MAG: DNA cytosine methyltransferase [Firmicutes bacterium]|nr:DNA cytosine methyltransferase [Bacillota bacterium]
MSNLTLGSLFDGSGGFPLGGLLCGIQPIWASEIEPFPIRVTTKRIPSMKHLGDISKINGGEIEPVDIITFGSPCTDLSVAGLRSGLDGKQSSLFYEAIRIIKEMREKTNGRYPRFAIWENVPGAFSSNKGADFKAVLEAFVSICEPKAEVPEAEKGKWPYSDILLGDGWSVAYRTIDAQYFGVPQRRRRIYLVADFAGTSAGEVLFERQGVSRDFTPSGSPWERTPCNAEGSTTAAISFEPGAMSRLGKSPTTELTSTLRAQMGDNQTCVAVENHPTDGRVKLSSDGTSQTLTGRMGTGGGNVPLVMNERQYALTVGEDIANTLTSTDYKGTQCVFENHSQDTRYIGPLEKAQTVSATYGMGGNNQPFVVSDTPKTLKIRSGCRGGGKGALIQNDKSATLGCNNDQTVFVPTVYDSKQITSKDNRSKPKPEGPCHTLAAGNTDGAVVCFGICSDGSNSMKSDNPASGIYEADTSRTIDANGGNPSCNQGGMAVVSLQGSMIGRKNENGPNGSGINEDVSFTLNTVDVPGVVYALDRASYNQGKNAQYDFSVEDDGTAQTVMARGPGAVSYAMTTGGYMQISEDKAPTLMSRDYKDAPVVSEKLPPDPHYTVRRLTPLECCRLQGFPNYWCSGLETANPTAVDIIFWKNVFETHRIIMGKSTKPKSEKQIVKWLKNPYSDSAEYKMWGNGVALPCIVFVLKGITEQVNPTQ